LSTLFAKARDLAGQATRPTERGETGVSIPLYVGGALVQIAGLAAIGYQLSEPTFASFTMTFTIVGMAVSYFLRRIGLSPRLLRTGAVFLGLIFLYALRGNGPFADLIPYEARGSQEMMLVCALGFTATFCSFLLLSDDAVVFTCVWAIAMIGLTGTVNINRELIWCFIGFLGAASFLLVHQNYLANGISGAHRNVSRRATDTEASVGAGDATSLRYGAGRRVAPNVPRRDTFENPWEWWGLLRTQAVVALACGATALVAGTLVAIPMQMVGRNLSLGAIIQRLNVPSAAAQRIAGSSGGPNRLTFDNWGEFNVGLGPVSDDPAERATVISDKPFYWRGRTYDQYTKRGWANGYVGPDARQYLKVDGVKNDLNVFNIPKPDYPRAKTERHTARFHINSGQFAPLYHAVDAVVVRAPIENIIRRRDGTMASRSGFGNEYEVDSSVSVARPSDLRKSGSNYPFDIKARYIVQGTESDNPVLQALAAEATAGANNPYERAEAIRQFVAARCIYTTDARSVPEGQDPAEFFLNTSREGYCDLYATGLTILCRYAGLPARVATGFAPGLPTGDASARKWILRGSDLHSWTEVYFVGYGWITFDATQDTPGTYAAPRTPEPIVKSTSLWERLLDSGPVGIGLLAVGLGGLLYVVASELIARFGKMRLRRQTRGASGEVLGLYYPAVRQVTRQGRLSRAAAQTPGDLVRAARASLGDEVADALAALTRPAETALYSVGGANENEARAAREAAQTLKAALRRAPRPQKKAKKGSDAPVVPAQ